MMKLPGDCSDVKASVCKIIIVREINHPHILSCEHVNKNQIARGRVATTPSSVPGYIQQISSRKCATLELDETARGVDPKNSSVVIMSHNYRKLRMIEITVNKSNTSCKRAIAFECIIFNDDAGWTLSNFQLFEIHVKRVCEGQQRSRIVRLREQVLGNDDVRVGRHVEDFRCWTHLFVWR